MKITYESLVDAATRGETIWVCARVRKVAKSHSDEGRVYQVTGFSRHSIVIDNRQTVRINDAATLYTSQSIKISDAATLYTLLNGDGGAGSPVVR